MSEGDIGLKVKKIIFGRKVKRIVVDNKYKL